MEYFERAMQATLQWTTPLFLHSTRDALHTANVVDLSGRLAIKLGYTPDEAHCTRLGAGLHDVGKVGVPEELLSGGHLTPAEKRIVWRHIPFNREIYRKTNVPIELRYVGMDVHEDTPNPRPREHPLPAPSERAHKAAKVVAFSDQLERAVYGCWHGPVPDDELYTNLQKGYTPRDISADERERIIVTGIEMVLEMTFEERMARKHSVESRAKRLWQGYEQSGRKLLALYQQWTAEHEQELERIEGEMRRAHIPAPIGMPALRSAAELVREV